jgi:hypothetical protein
MHELVEKCIHSLDWGIGREETILEDWRGREDIIKTDLKELGC